MCSEEEQAGPSSLSRLLLIEDAEDVQTVVKLGLKLIAGFQVVAVKCHEDWLALVQTQPPDLILLDIPSNEGNLLAKLYKSSLTQNIPVICLVPRDRTYDRQQLKHQGATAVIAKPFDIFALADVISKILAQSQGNA